jgi:hypothetical protein
MLQDRLLQEEKELEQKRFERIMAKNKRIYEMLLS